MMHVDKVYAYPIWAVALLLIGFASAGAVVIELVARWLLPVSVRQAHNDVAAPMFCVIGTTFAVLLAFVAMLAWESFGTARTAAVNEAAIVHDVADASDGLSDPTRVALRTSVAAYLHAVIDHEWPAQAAGRFDDSGAQPLRAMNRLAARYAPKATADASFQGAVVAALARLQDARATRRQAATSNLPPMIWVVMLLGGGLTVLAGSFLCASSLRMQLVMSTTLATSGALVVLLVVVLSQPFRGDFRVSTSAYESVLADVAIQDDNP